MKQSTDYYATSNMTKWLDRPIPQSQHSTHARDKVNAKN